MTALAEPVPSTIEERGRIDALQCKFYFITPSYTIAIETDRRALDLFTKPEMFNFVTSRTRTHGLRGFPLRLCITLTAVTGFSLFGYDQGLMSGIITGDRFNEEFPPTTGESHHATVIQGAVVSCYEVGCFIGAIASMIVGDRFGRRPMVLMGSTLMIVGTIISTTAFGPHWGLGQFVVGRVISGLGNGMDTATLPVWQAEMSKAENRGLLVSFEGSVIAIGTFIANWIDFGFHFLGSSSVQWRFPVAFQIVFAALLFFGMANLPESPRWLVAQGRNEEARYVLNELAGAEANEKEIAMQLRVVQESVRRSEQEAGFSALLTNGKEQHFRRMMIGASSQFFQQWTGCNAAIYYSTVLFSNVLHKSRTLSLLLGGVFGTVYAISTIPAFFLIERIGRRKLFLIGAIGQGCSFIITLACLAAGGEQNAKGAAVGLYLFIVFFAFTILQLPWVYPPEINSDKTRTAATSVSTATNWACNAAVVLITPLFLQATTWGAVYLFFAIINFAFVPIIFFFYPETSGRTLEEIDIIFAKAYMEKKPTYRVASTMPKLSNEEIEQEGGRLGLYDVVAEKSSVDADSADGDSARGTRIDGAETQGNSTPSEHGEALA